jgi:hypothetical protein
MNTALDLQTERIRAMTADERVQLSHALWLEAKRVTTAGVRATHPDWSSEKIDARVQELMCDAGA